MAANKWRGRQMFACILRNYGSWPVILYKRKAAYSLGMTAGDLADLIDPTCMNMDGRRMNGRTFSCSECGYETWTYDDSDCDPWEFSYCPNCGARVVNDDDK